MLYLHTDLLDNGLSALTSATLSMSVCQGAPTTREEAAELLSGTGKRVSNAVSVAGVDVSLNAGPDPNTRRVTIAPQAGEVTVAVGELEADLWIAVFDATRLLVVTAEFTNQPLAVPDPITIPEIRVTYVQPVIEA